MKLATAKELKTALLADLAQQTVVGAAGASIQSIVPERPEKRLAVGFSRIEKEDYHLEIRLQREGGWAHEKAREFQAKASNEVTIEVVDNVEVPSIVALQSASEPRWMTKPYRKRPLHLGLPVGHAEGGSGTLGAFVETKAGDEAILSCNHVLAVSNKGKNGDEIFQPGPSEGKLFADNLIGRLSNYPKLVLTRRNTTDAAIAILEGNVSHEGSKIPSGYNFPNENKRLRRPRGPSLDLAPDTKVCKIGRTTGYTRGIVTAVGLDGLTVYNPPYNLMFNDVIEISWLSNDDPFSDEGDSGSVLFTEEGLVAVGLLFAGASGKKKSFACDLYTVLDELTLELL